MFTGIVEEVGQVVALDPRGDSAVLSVRAPRVVAASRSASRSPSNGVCLTVIAATAGSACGRRRHGRDARAALGPSAPVTG